MLSRTMRLVARSIRGTFSRVASASWSTRRVASSAIRMSGWIYLVAAVILSGVFIGYAVTLQRRYSDRLSRQTFRYSIAYLAALFSALLFDHYWR